MIASRPTGGRAFGRGLRSSSATSRNRTRAEFSACCSAWSYDFAASWASGPLQRTIEREFPGRTDLISSVFDSLAAASIEADGDPTTSHDGTDFGPDGPDATLSYCVGRDGGRVVPWVDADQHQRLRGAFAPGGVVQGRYRIDRELGRGGMGVVFLGAISS